MEGLAELLCLAEILKELIAEIVWTIKLESFGALGC